MRFRGNYEILWTNDPGAEIVLSGPLKNEWAREIEISAPIEDICSIVGDFMNIYNFLMDNQIIIAVVLALLVSLSFRGVDLVRWIRKKIIGKREQAPEEKKAENDPL